MVLANVTGFEKLVVVALVAAVPLLVGFVIGRWWAVGLAFTPLAFGYVAYRDRQWELMSLYVPPVAFLLVIGIGAAKLTRLRAER